MPNKNLSDIARALGSQGGKQRAKKLSPKRRSQIAQTAAAASAKVRSEKAKNKK
jgi:hypothetical protein